MNSKISNSSNNNFISLEELNSNPIYQPPKKWLDEIHNEELLIKKDFFTFYPELHEIINKKKIEMEKADIKFFKDFVWGDNYKLLRDYMKERFDYEFLGLPEVLTKKMLIMIEHHFVDYHRLRTKNNISDEKVIFRFLENRLYNEKIYIGGRPKYSCLNSDKKESIKDMIMWGLNSALWRKLSLDLDKMRGFEAKYDDIRYRSGMEFDIDENEPLFKKAINDFVPYIKEHYYENGLLKPEIYYEREMKNIKLLLVEFIYKMNKVLEMKGYKGNHVKLNKTNSLSSDFHVMIFKNYSKFNNKEFKYLVPVEN